MCDILKSLKNWFGNSSFSVFDIKYSSLSLLWNFDMWEESVYVSYQYIWIYTGYIDNSHILLILTPSLSPNLFEFILDNLREGRGSRSTAVANWTADQYVEWAILHLGHDLH